VAKKTASKKAPSKKGPDFKKDAKQRAEAKKKAKEYAQKALYHRDIKKGEKTVEVKGLVNMQCMDGYNLEVGKICTITEGEKRRLDADKRGDFFEKV